MPTVQAFEPAVHVSRDGTIGVTYFDLRNNTNDAATLLTDYWLARSSDGGATWRESQVAGPLDLAIAPNAEGIFVGDYQGLASSDNVFVPFYAQPNAGNSSNRTDVFVSLMTGAMRGAGPSQAANSARSGGLAAHAMRVAGPSQAANSAPSGRLGRDREAEVFVARSAPPLVPSAELARRLDESAARTLQRRAHR